MSWSCGPESLLYLDQLLARPHHHLCVAKLVVGWCYCKAIHQPAMNNGPVRLGSAKVFNETHEYSYDYWLVPVKFRITVRRGNLWSFGPPSSSSTSPMGRKGWMGMELLISIGLSAAWMFMDRGTSDSMRSYRSKALTLCPNLRLIGNPRWTSNALHFLWFHLYSHIWRTSSKLLRCGGVEELLDHKYTLWMKLKMAEWLILTSSSQSVEHFCWMLSRGGEVEEDGKYSRIICFVVTELHCVAVCFVWP